MRNLEVTIGSKLKKFTGHSRESALDKLRQFLLNLDDPKSKSVCLDVAYKEYRKLYFNPEADNDLGIGYCIEISENGVGETRQFEDWPSAVTAFLRIAAENGDHWD